MIEIGTFEAKTHFSEIIRRVQNGESFCITHRGKKVATLKATKSKSKKPNKSNGIVVDEAYRKHVKETVGRWRELKKISPVKATLEEIIAWKNEGRR